MPPTLTRSCVHQMITTTIGTFICELTNINVVVRILLTTFPVRYNYPHCGHVFDICKIAMGWVCITRPSLLYNQLLFFRVFWGVKIHYICIRLYCFPLFFNWYFFHFSHNLLFELSFYFLNGAWGEFFTCHNPITYVQEFVRVCFDTDIVLNFKFFDTDIVLNLKFFFLQ